MFNIDTIRNTVFGELGDNVQLYFDIEGILVSKTKTFPVGYITDHKKDVIYVGVIRWHQDKKMIEQNMYDVIEQIKNEIKS
jgi:hypothetical protein